MEHLAFVTMLFGAFFMGAASFLHKELAKALSRLVFMTMIGGLAFVMAPLWWEQVIEVVVIILVWPLFWFLWRQNQLPSSRS